MEILLIDVVGSADHVLTDGVVASREDVCLGWFLTALGHVRLQIERGLASRTYLWTHSNPKSIL